MKVGFEAGKFSRGEGSSAHAPRWGI
jgi:hypothetical protein